MAIYQSQYLYMKKHVYELEEAGEGEMQAEEEIVRVTAKKDSRKGGKNRRKRKAV